MLHVTYGVYLNGDWHRNVVSCSNLASHIAYNIGYRPGRCLIVDGQVVHRGYLTQEAAEAFVVRIPELEIGWRPMHRLAIYS